MSSKYEKRLARLEAHANSLREDEQAVLSEKVLSCLNLEEQRWYVRALKYAVRADGVFAEEDYPILTKVEELRAEVHAEQGT